MIFDVLVVGGVRNNPLRALVSIVAIALGVATALALWLSSSLTLATLDADRALFTNHLDFQVLPYASGVPGRVLANLRYLPGVASASPVVDRPVAIGVDPRTGAGGISARLLGVDVLQPLPGVSGFDEGRPGPFAPVGTFIDPAALIDTNGAILSAQSARALHVRRGDRFSALAGTAIVTLRVANVLPANVDGIDSSVLFTDVTTAQTIFHMPQAYDRIDVVTDTAPQTLRPRLLAAVGNGARLVDPEAGRLSLGNLSRGLEATFGTIAAIALAVGGLLVFNAVGTSIVQRRGDIGTMRSLGVAPRTIVATFVLEGAAYGAIGAAFGVGLGVATVRAVGEATQAAYAANAADLWPIVAVFALGVGIAALSALVPALSAMRVPPALAARQGAFEDRSRAVHPLLLAALGACALAGGIALGFHPAGGAPFSLGFPLCFAVAGALSIPWLLHLAGRTAKRYSANAPAAVRFASLTLVAIPQRIGIAVTALAIAVFASVAFEISSGSFETALAVWAERGIAGDLIVRPAGAAGGANTFGNDALVRTQATPGVRAVAALRTVHVRSGTSDIALRGDDDFVPPPAPRVESTEAPAAMTSGLAAALHVRRGDTIEIRAPVRDVRVRVVDVRPDFSDGRGEIVVARSFVRDTFGDDRIDALRVTLDRRANVPAVRTAITRSLAPLRLTIVTTRELRERLERVFGGAFVFARGLGIVVVAIAVLGIASALAAIVFERRFELRMLRRIGASRGTIARMLLLEALAIATIASLLGLALGVSLAAVVLGGSDPVTLGFAIPLHAPVARLALVVAATIAAATLGTMFSLPAAFRLVTDGVARNAV